jgi:hypothetical protein
MSKKIISYKFNEDKTIPSFVQDGGYFPFGNTWEDTVVLGVSKENSNFPETVTQYSTVEDLISYLNTYTFNWKEGDVLSETKTTFNSTAAATFLFSLLNS